MSAILLSLGLGIGLAACSSGSDPSPDDSPAASAPTSATTPVPGKKIDPASLPEKTLKAVDTGSDDYFEGLMTTLADPEAVDPVKATTLPGIDGAALEELRNTLAEYRENDWRVTGSPRVLSTRVLEATEDPDTVKIVACVDNSDVRLLDAKGDEVPNSRPPHPRTRNVLTLVPQGDTWVVGAQRVATRPNC